MTNGSQMPYALAVTFHSLKPNSSDNRKLTLEVSLRDDRIDEGATTEAKVVVVNRTNETVPTPIGDGDPEVAPAGLCGSSCQTFQRYLRIPC